MYKTGIKINNGTPQLKSPKNQNREPVWTASNKITERLQLVCGRPTLALSSALVPRGLTEIAPQKKLTS